MSSYSSDSIPRRWLYCPRKSDGYIAEKFLAFKTPLSDRYSSVMPVECQFPPEMVFSFVRHGKDKLGLWIDLTNTNRFYSSDEVESRKCHYVKLQCRGHGETPSRQQTQAFIEIIDEFINDRPLDKIAVHCTHGFNRTGFLIVSYMVEKMDCQIEAALNSFAAARPPGIYKEDYIRELYRRYDDENDAIAPPTLPDWYLEYDDSDRKSDTKKRHYDTSESTFSNGSEVRDYNDHDANSGNESDQPTQKRRRKEVVRKDAEFMDGVSGVNLVLDQRRLRELQQTVQNMCGWKSRGFPGCQPVSMGLENILLLSKKPYRVSWKADGTRYMMLILDKDEIYFFDRDNSCFQVENIQFRRSSNLNEHIKNTLLDGEMVIDINKDNNIRTPRYLVYDIIVFEGKNVGKEPFYHNRRDYIKNEIVQSRYRAMECKLIDRAKQSFSIRDKEFWDLTQTCALLSPKFARSLLHEPDGLIFQPSLDPYTAGQSLEVLKWKPPCLNSVDFRLKIGRETAEGMLPLKIGFLYVGKKETYFAKIKFTKQFEKFNEKIIECKFEKNEWVFMRHRPDKSYPNSYDTAKAVINSIKQPVTAEYLLDFINKRRFRDDSDKMPPPQPQNHLRK